MTDRYLYIWMQRERPRRKGAEPGPWWPRGFSAPVDQRGLEQMQYCVGIRHGLDGGRIDRKHEHAIFRVPADAMEQIGLAPASVPAASPLFAGGEDESA